LLKSNSTLRHALVLLQKKQPIPPVWTYDDSVSESPIKNFVAGVKKHLLADYPDGIFEYAQSFVEFRVYRHGV